MKIYSGLTCSFGGYDPAKPNEMFEETNLKLEKGRVSTEKNDKEFDLMSSESP